MKNKSKFTTFILSCVPGLSHFYIGYAERGFIYLIIFGMICALSLGLALISGEEDFILFAVFGYFIIWMISVIDAFSTLNKIKVEGPQESKWNSEEEKTSNKKTIALALSIVPGVGHMYLGQMQKGLTFLATFLFGIFIMGFLNLIALLFLLPLIWFYSFFDAFHVVNNNTVDDVEILNILPKISNKHLGIGLIFIGAYTILQNILLPTLNDILRNIFETDYMWELRNYIQSGIIALIFIGLGLNLLKKKKEIELMEDELDEE